MIQTLEAGSGLLFTLFFEAKSLIKPGVSGTDLEKWVEKKLTKYHVQSALKNFHSFPSNCCVSVNECAAHGVPKAAPLVDGDLVTLDLAIQGDGWYADGAWTYGVGTIDSETLKLISVAWKTTMRAALSALTGKMVGDITRSAWDTAQGYGYAIPSSCYGHGIGLNLHELPRIPFYCGDPLYPVLRETPLPNGVHLNIEPILYKSASPRPEPLVKTEKGLFTSNSARAAQYEVTVSTGTIRGKGTIPSLPGIHPFDPRLQRMPPFY
ncbi:MAG: M24 family metallopeptidase [Spirochaetales bacterium]|nr:M24 family metallopeptidase [Spirochaetales bacterium]